MGWFVKFFEPAPLKTAAQEVERVRNMLAFVLVGCFVTCLPALLIWPIPQENSTILTYMVGQLSGMALTVIGFYFINKVGADAADAKRADNTAKLVDLAANALGSSPPDAVKAASNAADEVAAAATDKADEIGNKA